MAVTDLAFSMYQGNRRVLNFTVLDEETSNPKDLSTFEVTFAVALMNSSGIPVRSNPVIDHRTTDISPQVTITDAANGLVQVELLCADTENLAARDYYFELEVHDAFCGVVVATGTMTLQTNVSNA